MMWFGDLICQGKLQLGISLYGPSSSDDLEEGQVEDEEGLAEEGGESEGESEVDDPCS